MLLVLALGSMGCSQLPLSRAPQNKVGQNSDESTQSYEIADGLEFLKHFKAWDFKKAPLTLGIEVEAVVPNTVSDPDVLHIIMNQIHAQHPKAVIKQINASSLEYQSSRTSPTYIYKTDRDKSINPPAGFRGIELISPILRTQHDVEVFYKILEQLHQQLRLTAAPMSAGVHVHIGFPKAQSEELSLLGWLFDSIEAQVHDKFKTILPRLKWANYTDAKVKELYKNKDKQLRQQPKPLDHKAEPHDNEFFKPTWSKHYGLNFTSLPKLGTVEFRFANSSTNVAKVRGFVNFTSTLVKAVRSHDPRLIKFLEQHRNRRALPLEKLVQALDIKVDFQAFDYKEVEQFFALSKNLNTSNKYGNNHLVEAVFSGDHRLVEVLLKNGASLATAELNIKKTNKHDDLLSRALMSGNPRVLKLLFQYGLKAKKARITKAIESLVYAGQRTLLLEVLRIAPRGAVTEQHLSMAIQRKDALMVQDIVATGLPLTYKHLHEATSLHAEAILDILLEAGAVVNNKILSYANTYASFVIIDKLVAAREQQRTQSSPQFIKKCWQLLSGKAPLQANPSPAR